MHTVIITDYVQPPAALEAEALGDGYEVAFLEQSKSAEERARLIAEAEAVIVWHEPIDRDFAAAARRCKLVVRYGVGFDNVDLEALRERGIRFSNNPDYGINEVSDTAVAFMLAANRRILEYARLTRGCPPVWQEQRIGGIRRLTETRVGVVGLGRIGAAVALKMKALGAQVSFYDPHLAAGIEKTFGIERVRTLGELAARSDLLTLHCPLTPETRNMIDARILARLPTGASLINTARGAVVTDFEAWLSAVESDRIHGLFLDVLPEEPPSSGPIRDFLLGARGVGLRDRVIVSPHSAYYSDDAYAEMRRKVGEIVREFFESGVQRNRIV